MAVLALLGLGGFAGDKTGDSPYAVDPQHAWNRLHRALFVRAASDGTQHVHGADPLLFRGGTFDWGLLQGLEEARDR